MVSPDRLPAALQSCRQHLQLFMTALILAGFAPL